MFRRYRTRTAHQQLLGCLALIGILAQAPIDEILSHFREAILGRKTRRGLVDNVLQQLEDAHRHSTALQTDTLALPPVLLLLGLAFCLLCWILLALAGQWMRRGERAFEVGQVTVVRG